MRSLSDVSLPVSCRFIKLDIKDFYMSGEHALLTKYSAMVVDPGLREDYEFLTNAVLKSQYVAPKGPLGGPQGKSTSSNGTFNVYKVLSGAGMGMAASGHVADACFYHLVEKDSSLNPLLLTPMVSFFTPGSKTISFSSSMPLMMGFPTSEGLSKTFKRGAVPSKSSWRMCPDMVAKCLIFLFLVVLRVTVRFRCFLNHQAFGSR